jgi:beta-mannosidase
MKTTYLLSSLDWLVAGFTPFQWQIPPIQDIRTSPAAEIPPVKAFVPGSVQSALLNAGVIPDWNQGVNYRQCEWVENRHWIYQARIPAEWLKPGAKARLRCLGLDDRGWILVDGQTIASFKGAFVPYEFDLTEFLCAEGGLLQIVFDCPPRWLGQFGYTSQMTEWRSRYNYTWDWTARLVQVGIWDEISLEVVQDGEIEVLQASSSVTQDGSGSVRVTGKVTSPARSTVQINLEGAGVSQHIQMDAEEFNRAGLSWQALPVELWWPNGEGSQPLYRLDVKLYGADGGVLDQETRTLGFKKVEWLACEGAARGADPWICTVNGKPVFLQGINWTPIRPNFADVSLAAYRKRLELYRDLGCNIMRVWGGAFLEKEGFYELCDELGLLVWQEFPLSSSGIDNWPPEDLESIAELAKIAESYILRRKHHVSLLCWCGGNELQGSLDGRKTGGGKPVDLTHPLIRRLEEMTRANDPERRFLVTSSSGPRFSAERADFGKGLHWDVHGPWKPEGSLEAWADYWGDMDALFHSEVGAPGASPADVIRRYAGGLPELPGTYENALWRRTLWWIEWPEFVQELGREPGSLEEFVDWSQGRQATALAIVAGSLKKKFPRCGGVIFWMGHDSYPCTANTSIIDFEGRPKPAALALQAIFKERIP